MQVLLEWGNCFERPSRKTCIFALLNFYSKDLI